MKLRNYQDRIAAVAAVHNTIVMLPTGSGKTLIAAEVIKKIGPPAVFFVPTCLLVEQQAAAIRDWTSLRVSEFMGGAKLDCNFDVLVTTPKAFEVAQARGGDTAASLRWSSFRLVAFDEVHHVLKDHPYRKLATALRRSGAIPRVLGMTASLTYSVGKAQVEAAVHNLCSELKAETIQVAEASEMAADGYRGGVAAPAEVIHVTIPVVDQDRGLVPPADRKPHLLLPTFLKRVTGGLATSFSLSLMSAIRAMEATVAASTGGPPTRGASGACFKSPIDSSPLREWGEAAHAMAADGKNPHFAQLEHYYEALRLLVISWEAADDAASTYLRMFKVDTVESLSVWPVSARGALDAFWAAVPTSFPRFEHLCDVLRYKYEASHGKFRGIVFVEQRAMTHILEHIITSCPSLSANLNPACIYATSSPATASLRVTKSDSAVRLAAFSAGSLNLLICTVVAEEGMDVPAANCVVRFDAMVHSVSFVQGRGRARAEGSSYVVLAERDDRPVALLADVEHQQLAIVREIARGGAGGGSADLKAQERKKQTDRDRSAAAILPTLAVDPATALGTLNLYCKKTKVVLAEDIRIEAGEHIATFNYESCLRLKKGIGRAKSAKIARQCAAVDLISKLL
jgi:ERCC4-related helicase